MMRLTRLGWWCLYLAMAALTVAWTGKAAGCL